MRQQLSSLQRQPSKILCILSKFVTSQLCLNHAKTWINFKMPNNIFFYSNASLFFFNFIFLLFLFIFLIKHVWHKSVKLTYRRQSHCNHQNCSEDGNVKSIHCWQNLKGKNQKNNASNATLSIRLKRCSDNETLLKSLLKTEAVPKSFNDRQKYSILSKGLKCGENTIHATQLDSHSIHYYSMMPFIEHLPFNICNTNGLWLFK